MTTVNSLAAHAAVSPVSNDDLSGALDDISHLEQEIKQMMQEMMVLLQRALSHSPDDSGTSPVGGAGAPQTRLAMPGGSGDVDDGSGVDDDSDVADGDGEVDDSTGTEGNSGAAESGNVTPSDSGNSGSPRGASDLSGKALARALSPSESHQMAESFVTHLMSALNIPRFQAEGIVANLYHESGGMNADISQGGGFGGAGGYHADDNSHGFGMGQWSGDRLEGLKAMAAKTGDDVGSPRNAFNFIVQELKGPYSGALDALRNTKSAEEAVAVFSAKYEQPSDPEMASRLADLKLV
ncbi:phage tail tip lysozyme [Pandoraea sp. NPDC087047]|uniref:phage tail tip lysozyme n=1 Tax=Pandoraea sp. NPDC087047 TaxID=3364390 RepID=UPI00381B7DC4